MIDFTNCIDLLKKEGVGVIPTDTVYGLVAQALSKKAVKRLYRLKNRDRKPGTIIAANINQLEKLGVDKAYLQMASQYWSQPISVILPVNESLFYLHQGIGSLAFRIVSDKSLVDLLLTTGPLMTSSANHPGRPVANNINEAKDYFGNLVDFYVDGGDLSNRQASTIIRLRNDTYELIRQGSFYL